MNSGHYRFVDREAHAYKKGLAIGLVKE